MLELACEDSLTAPEAGVRLWLTTRDIYDLIFSGLLDGQPDRKGKVRIAAAEVERYRTGHLEG